MVPDRDSSAIVEYIPDRESIGAFVRARRAELAGVGQRFVSELERGKPTLRMDVVNAVLAVLGKCLGVVDASREDEEG